MKRIALYAEDGGEPQHRYDDVLVVDHKRPLLRKRNFVSIVLGCFSLFLIMDMFWPVWQYQALNHKCWASKFLNTCALQVPVVGVVDQKSVKARQLMGSTENIYALAGPGRVRAIISVKMTLIL